MDDQGDRDYIELVNDVLREYNLRAPQVDPVRFARIREVLGCDEFTALFILGTQVPLELSLISNRKLPASILENGYHVRSIPCDFVTVAELSEYFLVPVEGVRTLCTASSGESYSMWCDDLFERMERTQMRMAINGVTDVLRDEGMFVNQARAVKVHTRDTAEDEAWWICVGQRVSARRWASDTPKEGEVISIAPIDGVASVRLAHDELFPGVRRGLFRLEFLEPLDGTIPFARREPVGRAGCTRSRDKRASAMFKRRLDEETDRDKHVLSAIIESYYAQVPMPPFDYGRLFSDRLRTECDSEVAFFVLGTQMPDEHALVVNRMGPQSDPHAAFALEELPSDVLTVLRLASYFMRETHELRRALIACSFDLSGAAGRALVEDLRVTRKRMRANGITGVMRREGMGVNEASSVSIADEAFLAEHDDTTILDGTTFLIVGRRARVVRGDHAGIEGAVVSLAPVDGHASIAPDDNREDENVPAVVVRIQDAEYLAE